MLFRVENYKISAGNYKLSAENFKVMPLMTSNFKQTSESHVIIR